MVLTCGLGSDTMEILTALGAGPHQEGARVRLTRQQVPCPCFWEGPATSPLRGSNQWRASQPVAAHLKSSGIHLVILWHTEG